MVTQSVTGEGRKGTALSRAFGSLSRSSFILQSYSLVLREAVMWWAQWTCGLLRGGDYCWTQSMCQAAFITVRHREVDRQVGINSDTLNITPGNVSFFDI